MSLSLVRERIIFLPLFFWLGMILVIGLHNHTLAESKVTLGNDIPQISSVSTSINNTSVDKLANTNSSGLRTNTEFSAGFSSEGSANQPFNPNIPITIPLLEGYHNGTKIYFIHPEASDSKVAEAMTRLTNFPTSFMPNLESRSEANMSKMYVFTNGLPALEDFGGGPFEYQISVFDSIPPEKGYSNLRTVYTVEWKDPTTARILDSVPRIIEAQSNGELIINKTGVVVNSPIISWIDRGEDMHRVYSIEKVVQSMPSYNGKVIYADIYNFVARLKLVP